MVVAVVDWDSGNGGPRDASFERCVGVVAHEETRASRGVRRGRVRGEGGRKEGKGSPWRSRTHGGGGDDGESGIVAAVVMVTRTVSLVSLRRTVSFARFDSLCNIDVLLTRLMKRDVM